MTVRIIVVALGGNALQKKGEASAEAQQSEAAATARQLVPFILQGHQIVVVHGNGPQVGDILLHEEALNTTEVPTLPLDSCVAMTQGSVGYWLQLAIGNELRLHGSTIATIALVTQTVVDAADQAFAHPTKPIGPFYTSESEARAAAISRGFSVQEDSGRGWRRVVASPVPKTIVEKPIIEQLIKLGCLVIAAGGGGVPVVVTDHGLRGIEAVIDKDRSASVLADMIGADELLILTSVDAVKIGFGTPEETSLRNVSCERMQQYCDEGQFASGSMLPKVLASLDFVKKNRGQRKAIIASLESLDRAVRGESGTVIS